MIEVRQTLVFRRWLSRLDDERAVARIGQRIARLQVGLVGDAKAVGGGIGELRVWIMARDTGSILCGEVGTWSSSSPAATRAPRATTSRKPQHYGLTFSGVTVATKTVPFDAAAHLTDREAQRDLLAEAMASNDPAVISATLGLIARARGMTEVARLAGVTREALYRSLSPKGDPRLSTLIGVAKALGLQLSAVPAPLPDQHGHPGEQAV